MQGQVDFYDDMLKTVEIKHVEFIENSENVRVIENGICQHEGMTYWVSRTLEPLAVYWQVVSKLDARKVVDRVGQLGQEFRQLRHQIRSSMLPLREDAPVFRRVDAIKRECAAYDVDWHLFLQ